MGLVTITGTLATDESPIRSATSSFVIDVIDSFDTTQAVGTSYELVASASDAGTGQMWTVVENKGTQEAVVRCNLDGTNYTFFPLPGLSTMLIPTAMASSALTTPTIVSSVYARALTGSSTLRVLALFVA